MGSWYKINSPHATEITIKVSALGGDSLFYVPTYEWNIKTVCLILDNKTNVKNFKGLEYVINKLDKKRKIRNIFIAYDPYTCARNPDPDPDLDIGNHIMELAHILPPTLINLLLADIRYYIYSDEFFDNLPMKLKTLQIYTSKSKAPQMHNLPPMLEKLIYLNHFTKEEILSSITIPPSLKKIYTSSKKKIDFV